MPRGTGSLYSEAAFEKEISSFCSSRSKQHIRARTSDRSHDHNSKTVSCFDNRQRSKRRSTSSEADRRSRSRERQRRKRQCLTLKKSQKIVEESRVLWDGFQWISKPHPSDGNILNQSPVSRTRLIIGNLPSGEGEKKLKEALWKKLKQRQMVEENLGDAILEINFSKDGREGFVDLSSSSLAQKVLSLAPFVWGGNSISFTLPPDDGESLKISGLDESVAERLAAAAHQARLTGNTGGLVKLLGSVPPESQDAIKQLLNKQAILDNEKASKKSLEELMDRISKDLLQGPPSRVIRFHGICAGTVDWESVESDIKQIGVVVAFLRVLSRDMGRKLKGLKEGDLVVELATIAHADRVLLALSGKLYEGGRGAMITRVEESRWKAAWKPSTISIFLDQFVFPAEDSNFAEAKQRGNTP